MAKRLDFNNNFGESKGLSKMARGRLVRELEELNNETTLNIVPKLKKDQNGELILDKWDLEMKCPSGIYEGYVLRARISFPPNYPYSPPSFRFLSPMFHPNIYDDKNFVCVSILQTDADDITQSSEKKLTWTPALSVRTICLSIINLLNYPNIYSPANIEASNMFRDDYDRYVKKVVELLDADAAGNRETAISE